MGLVAGGGGMKCSACGAEVELSACYVMDKVVVACEQHFSMTINKRRSQFHRHGPR